MNSLHHLTLAVGHRQPVQLDGQRTQPLFRLVAGHVLARHHGGSAVGPGGDWRLAAILSVCAAWVIAEM